MTEKSFEKLLLEITEKALASNTPIVLRGEVVRKHMTDRELLELAADDRELLELAAKAAGMPYAGWQWSESDDDYMPWNPLDDDGDALRLAVRLKMAIGHYGCGTCEVVSIEGSVRCDEFNDTDSYAATRRAIVRAAAEIGRNMK